MAAGIGALLLTTIFEVGVVSAFDPNLDSLAARLVTQAMLAVTLVGIAFAVAGGKGGGVASSQALGLRRPLRSPFGMAAAAYLGYIVIALVYSSIVHPHQEDVTRDLGFGDSAFGTIAAGALIVVAAPISEEIFFRGFIFGGLRHRLSFPVAAVLSAPSSGCFTSRERTASAWFRSSPCLASPSPGYTRRPAPSTPPSRCTPSTTPWRSRS